MKPRQIHRGTLLSPDQRDNNSRSFNEAPANSPGNHRPENRVDVAGVGFNEAPANSPGNPVTVDFGEGGARTLQ